MILHFEGLHVLADLFNYADTFVPEGHVFFAHVRICTAEA